MLKMYKKTISHQLQLLKLFLKTFQFKKFKAQHQKKVAASAVATFWQKKVFLFIEFNSHNILMLLCVHNQQRAENKEVAACNKRVKKKKIKASCNKSWKSFDNRKNSFPLLFVYSAKASWKICRTL